PARRSGPMIRDFPILLRHRATLTGDVTLLGVVQLEFRLDDRPDRRVVEALVDFLAQTGREVRFLRRCSRSGALRLRRRVADQFGLRRRDKSLTVFYTGLLL